MSNAEENSGAAGLGKGGLAMYVDIPPTILGHIPILANRQRNIDAALDASTAAMV